MTIDAKEKDKKKNTYRRKHKSIYLHDLKVGKGFFSKTYKKFTENF